MTLSDLKRRGTKLVDVEPDFRGMQAREWYTKMEASQGDAYRESQKAKAEFEKETWKDKALATHRDNYGMKGIQPTQRSKSDKVQSTG